MKPGALLLASLLSALSTGADGALAQTLPPTVDPGVQRDRLLNRDPLRLELSPALLQEVDCGREETIPPENFTLKAVRLESVVASEKVDAKARWQPYLGQDVTLVRICEIARSLAADYARKSGQALTAVLPAQYIDGGVVRIVVRAEENRGR